MTKLHVLDKAGIKRIDLAWTENKNEQWWNEGDMKKGKKSMSKADMVLVSKCIKHKQDIQQEIKNLHSQAESCRRDIENLSPANLAVKFDVGVRVIEEMHSEHDFKVLRRERM